MAVAYRSSSASPTPAGVDSQTTSRSILLPTGAAVDDIMVLPLELNAGNPTVTYPSGWVEKLVSSNAPDLSMKVAWKRLTSGDISTGSVNMTWTGSQFNQAQAILLTGAVTTGDPFEVTNTAQADAATAVPSVAATSTTAVFWLHFAALTNFRASTAPTGYTRVQDANYLDTSYRIAASPGLETASGGTVATSTDHVVALLAVLPTSSTTPVTGTRATTWRVLAATTGARSTTWRVVARATSSRSTTWDVLTPVTASRSTTWRTLARVASTRATTWDVLTGVTGSRATTWRVRAMVTATRSTTWAVASALASVTATRSTTWVVGARVTSARITTWNTLSRLTNTRSTTWDVLAPRTSTRATTWRVRTQVSATRATTWEVFSNVTARDLTLVGVVESNHWTGSLEANRWAADIEPNRWEGTVPWPEL